MMHPDLQPIVEGLRDAGLTIGFAESCTGGRLAADLTTVPGSSRVVAGSLVCYQVAIKQRLLNMHWVTEENVVSQKVAQTMAESVRDVLSVDVGVSTTGYLDGDHPEAYFAVKSLDFSVSTHLLFPPSSPRGNNREVLIRAVMETLTRYAKRPEGPRESR